MNHNVGFVLKVLISSLLLAIAIKYGGPFLPLAPTSVNALILVLLPTLIMAGVLSWRARTRSSV
jgi:hypothetical protein